MDVDVPDRVRNRLLENRPGTTPSTPYYIVDDDGCWLWQRTIMPSGYGFLGWTTRRMLAHRAMFTAYRGPIAEGFELDHLCRVRRCVNPDHLEVVTRSLNQLRRYEYEREQGIRRPLTRPRCSGCGLFMRIKSHAVGECSQCGESVIDSAWSAAARSREHIQ